MQLIKFFYSFLQFSLFLYNLCTVTHICSVKLEFAYKCVIGFFFFSGAGTKPSLLFCIIFCYALLEFFFCLPCTWDKLVLFEVPVIKWYQICWLTR